MDANEGTAAIEQSPDSSSAEQTGPSTSSAPNSFEPKTSAQLRPRPGQDNGAEAATPPGDQEQQPKKESRYERTKRQRAEFQKREAVLRQREEQLAQIERERTKPKEPDYSLEDLRQYREEWAREAENEWGEDKQRKEELVKKADAEIKRLEGQQSFVQEWRQAEADLASSDPEFGCGKGTRIDKQLGDIMSGPDGNIYRQHPRGIIAAYHRARMEILESDHKGALDKIQHLETELKQLRGYTSIGGGAPGKVGGGSVDFSKLSSAEMRKYLKSGANKGDLPWL